MSSEKTLSRLYDSITKGDIEESFEIFSDYTIRSENTDFQDILNQVVIKINEDYQNQKISNATYHTSQIICDTLEKLISKI